MAGEINWGLLDTKAPERAANAFYDGQKEQQNALLAAANLQSVQQKNKLADLAMSDDEARRQAWKNGNGDTGQVVKNLAAAGQGKEAMDLQTRISAHQKDALAQQKSQIELHLKNFEAVGQIMSGVNDQASYDAARQQIAQVIGPEAAAKSPPTYDPAVIEKGRLQAMSVKDQLANQWKSVDAQLHADQFAETKANNQRGNLAERHAENNPAPGVAGTDNGMLDEQTKKMMAEQYLRGDTSVFTNLGRGAQGAKNIIALRQEIAKQSAAAGLTGADQAAVNAEYFGTKAGQRTVGTRTANVELATNEASQLLPLAREASANVERSGLLPFGKAQIMFDNQTNDPNLRQFAAANNSLINVYARAISPSGVPTVADKEHAREMLSTAYDNKSYNAVLDQMQKEMDAARKAPDAVRRTFNNAVTKRSDATAPAGSIPSGWSVKEH